MTGEEFATDIGKGRHGLEHVFFIWTRSDGVAAGQPARRPAKRDAGPSGEPDNAADDRRDAIRMGLYGRDML